MAWTYVTKTIVAALHNVDADILQDEWSTWVEAMISEHMGYKYVGETATITAEKHSGDGTPYVYVDYPPIVSVSSLELGTVTTNVITSTSYKVWDDHVELVNDATTDLSASMRGPINYFPIGVQNISITYVSGLATVPAIVQFTAAQMIAEIAKYKQRGGADHSTKFVPAQSRRGEGQAVVVERGLAATLQGIMRNTLRKRVIPLG